MNSKDSHFGRRIVMRGTIGFLLVSVGVVFIVLPRAYGGPGIPIPYTYQGRLTDASAPPGTNYEVRFQLYDAPVGGNPVGGATTQIVQGPVGPQPPPPVDFTVSLPLLRDIISQILCMVAQPWPPVGAGPWPTTWTPLYLEVAVKRTTDASYTVLSPRQELTPAPFAYAALYAGRAAALELPYAPTAGSSQPLVALTQTGDGPAAIFKIQPQPEPPMPSPAVEVESNTSAPALEVMNTGAGPAASFKVQPQPEPPSPSPAVEIESNTSAPALAVTNTGTGFSAYFQGRAQFTAPVAIGTSAFGTDQGGAIELGNSLTTGNNPYIDFHRGVGMAQDYNVRLQNDADQQLKVVGKLATTGNLTVSSGNLTVSTGDLAVSAGSLSVAQELTVTGELTVESDIKKAYSMGTSSRAVPIAYASVSVDGAGNVTGVVGTPNVSSVLWEIGNQRYVIAIAGESYSSTTHVTIVTPITTGAPEALFATTSSSSPAGTLRIRIMSSSTGTTGLGRPFQFIVYKP